MITENLSTLKIHKLTQSQYDNAVSSGTINENELYLTPYEEIDLTPYATIEQLNDLDSKVGNEPVATQIDNALANYSSGKTLTQHLAEEDMILSSRQYGDKLPGEDGESYVHVAGRIFFKRVSE